MCQNLFWIKVHYYPLSSIQPAQKSNERKPNPIVTFPIQEVPFLLPVFLIIFQRHISRDCVYICCRSRCNICFSWYILCELLYYLSFNCLVILVELFSCIYLSFCWLTRVTRSSGIGRILVLSDRRARQISSRDKINAPIIKIILWQRFL